MSATATMILPGLARVREVIALLPPGPFTERDFLGLAIGINAIDNCNQVIPVLAALTEAGDIMKIGEHLDMWVRLRQQH